MRVPVAESAASIRKLGVSTATADDFGGGIGRAQVQTGRVIRQDANIMSDVAIKMEHKRVVRERIEVYNAASDVANKELQEKVFSLRGAQTDVLSGDGFESLVGGIQTKAFSDAVKGRDSKVAEAAGQMWERRRVATQGRVGAHYSSEQERAYLEATDHGYKQTVRFAAEGLAAGKSPEADDFADAISATRAYVNARGLRRTDGEISREARSAVHVSAIEGMMVAGEFDRADTYLDFISTEEGYRKAVEGSDLIRPDGTAKGAGYLGEIVLPNGGHATEYSMQSHAVKVNGEMIDFPTLVPTLTKEEIELMRTDIIPNRKPIPETIVQKAIKHAKKRIRDGKSPFSDSNPYISDFDKKQVDTTRNAIAQGREKVRKQTEQQNAQFRFDSTIDALKTVSMGNMDLDSAAPMLREQFGEEGMQLVQAASERMAMADPRDAKIVQDRAYWDFMKEVRTYSKSKDKDGAVLRGLMAKTFAFGEHGDAARDELYLVASDTKLGGLQPDEFKFLNQQVDGLIEEAVGRNNGGLFTSDAGARKKSGPTFENKVDVGTRTSPEKTSEVALQLKGVVKQIASQQDLTFAQAKEMLESHPVFKELRDATNLESFQDNLDAFDRSGQWGTPYKSAPWSQ